MQLKKTGIAPANVLLLTTCLFWMGQYAHSSYLSTELQSMGADAAYIGMVASGYGLAQMLLRVPLGMLAGRLGQQKPFIVLGCLVCGISGLGMYLFYTPSSFLLFRFLNGVAAATWVNFSVLYGSYFAAGQSGKKLAILNIGNQTGRIAAFAAAVVVTALLGARGAFLLAGLTGLASGFVALFCTEPRTERANAPSLRKQLSVLRNKNLQWMTLLAILAQIAAFSTVYSFTPNMAAALGATTRQLSLLNLWVTVPGVLFNFLGARLLDRCAPHKLLAGGFCAFTLYCVAVPFAPSIGVLYLLQVVAGAGMSLTMGLMLGLCVQTVETPLRSSAMGFFQALYGIGMTLGPLMMGQLVQAFGLSTAFFCISVLSGMSAMVALRARE